MNNINSFIVLNRNVSNTIKSFISISLLIITTLLFILNLNYIKYYKGYGEVIYKNNSYKLLIYVDISKKDNFYKNDYIIISDKKYKYNIDIIYEDYEIINMHNYLKVILDINLSSEDKITNKIITYKYIESDKKLFYYLKSFLKGEKYD